MVFLRITSLKENLVKKPLQKSLIYIRWFSKETLEPQMDAMATPLLRNPPAHTVYP